MPETYKQAVVRAKREYLTRVMSECRFVVSDAAIMAGCNRTDFYRLLDKYAPLPKKPKPMDERKERRATGGNDAWKALDEVLV